MPGGLSCWCRCTWSSWPALIRPGCPRSAGRADRAVAPTGPADRAMGGDPVRGRATPAGMDGRAPKRLRCVGCWRWSSRAGWPACWCRCTWSSVPASIWSGYPRSTGREVERITPVVNPSRAGWPALLGRCSCSSGSCQPGTRAGQDRRTRPAPSAGHQIEPRAAIRCGAVLPQRVGRSSARAAAVRLCCWRWLSRAGWLAGAGVPSRAGQPRSGRAVKRLA